MNQPSARFFVGFMVILALAAAGRADNPAAPADEEASGLPIRTVVLYKHGVGYFERAGQVEGGQSTTLFFRENQMNDLLKSLVVLDLDGGAVDSIVYDSTRTVQQMLGDYPFRFDPGAGLPQVLARLQGSEVRLALTGETVRGWVVGVEERRAVSERGEQKRYLVTIMDADNVLRSFDADSIMGVAFEDARLNRDFTRYLQTLYQQHRREDKAVVIQPGGSGRRRLLVSYVTETPVWKATYRVIIPEADDDKINLQGWAIVDNVSEEDWENVSLALVSGLPVSFIQNLYDPIFRQRPVIAMDEQAAVAPTAPEAEQMARRLRPQDARARGAAVADMAAPAPMAAEEAFAYDGGPLLNAERMRELQAKAATREIGELFEYRIDHAVSIPRNQSALLPIVAEEVAGANVSLYNESVRAENPMAAVRFANTTGLTLEGGPLTVFQGASYVGEGLIETVKPDEQRYVTYAVDLGLRVETRNDSSTKEVFRVLIQRGTMRMFRYIVETKTYNLNNLSDKDKIVVIEHPINPTWRLLGDVEPIEKTAHYQRFEVAVPGGENLAYAVREQRDYSESVVITNLTPDDVTFYFRQNYIDDAIRDQLMSILETKDNIARLNREISQLREQREQITREQRRLIEIRSQLRETREEVSLAAEYIGRIRTLETQLDDIDERMTVLTEQLRAQENELDRRLRELSYDQRL